METEASDAIEKLKEDMQINWRTRQKWDESPLESYFREIDLVFADSTYGEYYQRALQEDLNYLTALLLEDFKFKADTFSNVVASIDGMQATGKSLSGLYKSLLLGKIFGRPFTLKNLYFTPEELDKALENAEYRTTHFMDEQRKTNIGTLSMTTQLRLADYEEQLRRSGISLLYAAPELRDHQHYFVFSTFKIIRQQTDVCQDCKKIKDPEQHNPCLNCPTPQDQRSGYPTAFLLMLQTKRLIDKRLVPRGLIKIPMPNPQIVEEYDVIKKEHIRKLKAKEEESWNQLRELAQKVFDAGKDRLMHRTKKGNMKAQSNRNMKIVIYDIIGMRRLTNEGYDLLIGVLKSMVDEHVMKENLHDEDYEVGNENDT
jgi:hypothetical protein